MNKTKLISALLILSVLICASFLTIEAAPSVMNGENVLIQAENLVLSSDCERISDSSASRSKAVKIQGTLAVENSGVLGTVKVNNPAQYTMWLLVKTNGTARISYRFSDDAPVYFNNISKPDYGWVKLRNFDYGAGNYEFFITSDNPITLDAVFITSGYTPSGKLPSGSPTYRSKYLGTTSVPAFPQKGIHPRLFVTEEDIPTLKEKLQTPLFRDKYEQIKEVAKRNMNYTLPFGATEYTDYSSYTSNLIYRAFVYLMSDADDNHALKTIREAKNFIGTVTFDKENSTYASRYMGDTMVMASCVYDWCYDLLTPADKTFIINKMKEFASLTEVGFPPTKRSYVISHGCESQIYLDQFAVGVAIYDEDPTWYNQTSSVVFSKLLPIKNFLSASGNDFSGSTYTQARNEGAVHTEQMVSALGYEESIFNENYEKLYYKFLYDRLPNGIWFKSGDDYAWDRYNPDNRSSLYGELFRYSGSAYDDPYLMREGMLDWHFGGGWVNIFDIIFTPAEPVMKDNTDLPMTHYTTYPMSSMTARTSWQNGLNAPTAMATVNMREVTVGDHQHRDIGAFQLWYKGMLALDSGLYVYSDHYYNYLTRSVAHNVMLVEDPNESFAYANDGGQRDVRSFGSIYNDLSTVTESIENGECITATDVHSYTGLGEYSPVFSYISGDITKAYSNKIEAYKRGAVFINLKNKDYPAALLVYDNLKSSDATFTKKWLLHSEEEPIIENNKVTIKRTQNGQSGKLVNYALMPESSVITPVGGKGKEFMVNGVNYPISANNGVQADMGAWRTEISSPRASHEDIFLNLMVVTDAGNNMDSVSVSKSQGSEWVSATVENNTVIFPKSRELVSEGFDFTVEDTGFEEYNLLVAETATGKWKIEGENTSFVLLSEEGKNCISLVVKPGTYTLTPAEDNMEITVFDLPEEEKENFGDFLIAKNNNLMYIPYPTVLSEGTPYVPVDGIFTQLWAVVDSQTSGEVTFTKGKNTVTLKTGELMYNQNGSEKTLTSVPLSVNGRVYCNIADFASVLGLSSVNYDHNLKLLKIRTK